MPPSPPSPGPFAEYTSLAAPVQAWQTGLQFVTMLAEAQVVVAYRVMGQMGMWSNTPDEVHRMLSEKPTAFLKSASAAMRAAQGGQRPDQVLSAAVMPLGRTTRSNMRRLARGGLTLAG